MTKINPKSLKSYKLVEWTNKLSKVEKHESNIQKWDFYILKSAEIKKKSHLQ
jgi:hypothetical protein